MSPTDNPRRIVSQRERARLSRALRQQLMEAFGTTAYLDKEETFLARNRKRTSKTTPATWRSVRIRNEIAVALTLIQERWTARQGRDFSQSEVLSAAVLEALPDLLRQIEKDAHTTA